MYASLKDKTALCPSNTQRIFWAHLFHYNYKNTFLLFCIQTTGFPKILFPHVHDIISTNGYGLRNWDIINNDWWLDSEVVEKLKKQKTVKIILKLFASSWQRKTIPELYRDSLCTWLLKIFKGHPLLHLATRPQLTPLKEVTFN